MEICHCNCPIGVPQLQLLPCRWLKVTVKAGPKSPGPLEGHQEEQDGKGTTWGEAGEGEPLFAAPAAQLLLQLLPCRWLKVHVKAGPKVPWRGTERNRWIKRGDLSVCSTSSPFPPTFTATFTMPMIKSSCKSWAKKSPGEEQNGERTTWVEAGEGILLFTSPAV